MTDGRAEQRAREALHETTLRTLLADAHDRGSGCHLRELHHYGRATDALDALLRVAATLRQALAFYADLDTYRSYDDVEETWPPEIREDKGKLARAALAAAGDTETETT